MDKKVQRSKSSKKFGDRVRALREEQQITLRKFAKSVGMSPTYLSKVEHNELKPGEEKVKAIAKALEQDSDEFLALAGRVSSELPKIIQREPREMALLLRVAKDLSRDQLEKLTKEAEKLKHR